MNKFHSLIVLVVFIVVVVATMVNQSTRTKVAKPTAHTQTALGATFIVDAAKRNPDGSISVKTRMSTKGRGGSLIYVNRAALIWKDKYVAGGMKVKPCKKDPAWQLADFTFWGLPPTVHTIEFSAEVWLKNFHQAQFKFPMVRPTQLPILKTNGNTSKTLCQVVINQPLPKGDWIEEMSVVGTWISPTKSVVSVKLDTTSLEGYVDSINLKLVDDRGISHEAIRVMMDSRSLVEEMMPILPETSIPDKVAGLIRPTRTHSPILRPANILHSTKLFIFEPIFPKPTSVSITAFGLVPPNQTDRTTVVFRGIYIP